MPGFSISSIGKSAEFNFAIAGLGGALGTATVTKMPQFLGQFTNLVIGVAGIAAGAFIDHDGISAFLVGAGVAYFVDGILKFVLPAAAQVQGQPSLISAISSL